MYLTEGHGLSLLAHVASRLTGQTEVLATESLCYVLSRPSPVARRALADVVRSAGAEVAEIGRVRTEVSGDEQERLDLVCFDSESSECILIEAKFWAGLTHNQPITYLDRLLRTESDPAVLLFVAPATRLETLWHEILNRTPGRFSLSEKSTRTATVGATGRWLILKSWREILGAIASRAREEGDVATERDVLQLNALCERQDAEAFLPLRAEEFGPEVPRRLINLQQLVNDATDGARAKGFADTTGLKVTPQPYGYGRYLRLGSENGAWACGWFGVHFELWARERETPLWLQFNGSDMPLAEITQRVGSDRIYFDLPTGVEYDRVLAHVSTGLEALAERVGGAADEPAGS